MSDGEKHAESSIVVVRCAVCGKQAARVELVAPGARPTDWDQLSQEIREQDARFHDGSKWRFIYAGVESGNGALGDDVSDEEALVLSRGFAEPLNHAKVHAAGLYDDAGFCKTCHVPYCRVHWGEPDSGYGRCPRGHGKSLDPHWSPDL